MKRLSLLLAAVLVATPTFAAQEYYRIGNSVRALGMGGAFFGQSDDIGAVFYNPAGLASVRGGERFTIVGGQAAITSNVFSVLKDVQNGAGQSVQSLAKTLEQYQGKTIHGNGQGSLFGFHRKNFAIALLVPDAKFNLGFLGAGVDTRIEATAITDAGLLVSFALPVGNTGWAWGVTGKGLVRAGGTKIFTLDDIVAGDKFTVDPKQIGGVGGGVDFDFGMTYDIPITSRTITKLRVGAALQNVLAQPFTMIKVDGGAPPGLVRTLNFGGMAALRGSGPFDEFRVVGDLSEFHMGGESRDNLGARYGSLWKHFHLGVEAPMLAGYFVPRVGVHQGYLTAGFSMDFRAAKLDFATYAEELARGVGRFGNRRLALRLEIGWGSAPPPPYAAAGDKPASTIPATPPTLEVDKSVPQAKPDTVTPPTPVPQLETQELQPKMEGPVQGLPRTVEPAPVVDPNAPAPAPVGGTPAP